MDRRAFLKKSAGLGAAGALGLRRGARAAAADVKLVELGQAAHLFVDDFLVAESRDLTRVLHKPVKQGLIEEADGSPWQRGDQMSVVRDGSGRFHMVYRFFWEDPSVRDLHPSIGMDKAHWFRRTAAYATSDDGIRWTKPVLGLFNGPTGFRPAPKEQWADGVFSEPTGFSKENNLGCPVSVLQDVGSFGGQDDPERRYLVNVLYRADTHNFADVTDAGLYFASDVPNTVGDAEWRNRMKAVWEGPRRGPRGENTNVAGFDAATNQWFVCTQSALGGWKGRDGRDIARYTSENLIDWSPEEVVLPVPDDESRDPHDWIEYMDMSVFRAGDVWLGQLVIFHGDRSNRQYEMPTIANVWRKGTTDLRLVASRDAGKTWQRVGGKETWLAHHEADDGYDRLTFAGSPVRVGDELWLYYNCWDGDHLVWNRDGTTYYKDRTRIARTARATLRWDGYASLDAGDETGWLVTRPLVFQGDSLFVNLDAPRGTLRAELQGADGTPIPGFTVAECIRARGNGVDLPLGWRSRPTLRPLVGKPVRIRFELARGSLYGFRFA